MQPAPALRVVRTELPTSVTGEELVALCKELPSLGVAEFTFRGCHVVFRAPQPKPPRPSRKLTAAEEEAQYNDVMYHSS